MGKTIIVHQAIIGLADHIFMIFGPIFGFFHDIM